VPILGNCDTEGTADALDRAIARLYDAFSAYTPATLHESCPHCVSSDRVAELHERPRRELSAEDLSYYSFKAMTTFGQAADWKYFLPRILELLAHESWPTNLQIVIGGKLVDAGVTTWPEAEQAAVREYFRALWERLLVTHPFHLRAEELLDSLARAQLDVVPLLERWAEAVPDNLAARLQLGEFVAWGPVPGQCTTWCDASAWEPVHSWVFSPQTAPLVERSFADYVKTRDGDKTEYKLAEYLALVARGDDR